ncbi:MAG TPA: hypothetical protein DIC56_18195 [Rhizobium sp.]|nr:hypothetical protein [Rhizobium sp.]
MVEKKPKASDSNANPTGKHGQGKTEDKAAGPLPEQAVDRPGFDLGGSSGKTSAGTGVGLGPDAAEDRSDRSLPGRKGKTS